MPVSPGTRGNLAISRTGTGKVSLGETTVGAGAFEEASVTTGAMSSEFGNAQSGLIQISTRTGGSRLQGSVGFETNALTGADHGDGFNAVRLSLSGPLYKNLTWSVAGDLEGRAGFDRGWDAIKSPEYVMAGTDTVINVPSLYGSPTADTTGGGHSQVRHLQRQLRSILQERQRRHQEQLRCRLPRGAVALFSARLLPGQRQAELHLRYPARGFH